MDVFFDWKIVGFENCDKVGLEQTKTIRVVPLDLGLGVAFFTEHYGLLKMYRLSYNSKLCIGDCIEFSDLYLIRYRDKNTSKEVVRIASLKCDSKDFMSHTNTKAYYDEINRKYIEPDDNYSWDDWDSPYTKDRDYDLYDAFEDEPGASWR